MSCLGGHLGRHLVFQQEVFVFVFAFRESVTFFFFFFFFNMFIAIFHLQVKLVTKLYIQTTLLYITDAKFDYYRLS